MINQSGYEVVIGLEVHAQLQTSTKLFCADSTSFGAEPNTQLSPISLAHPGTLPKLNMKAVELAVRLGLALHCEIERYNYFARKNYFYPDLPKGYQVSQHTAPICKGGYVRISVNNETRNIQLNRIHIEEDAGKSMHDLHDTLTFIDLNRAGVPLVEIVTEPCLHSADEAFAFLTALRKLVRWLDVCDGNMEEGSMRCDANISVRLQGETRLGKRVEIKNLNSIRNVKKAIEIETERLIQISEANGNIVQETRSFDADKNITFSLRGKEEADDYRYFPEPDLPPFLVDEKFISGIRETMPALPEDTRNKLMQEYGLSAYDASVITGDKETANLFTGIVKYSKHYKAVANWIIGPLKYYCNEHGISVDALPLEPEKIAGLIELVESGQVNFSNASTKILHELINDPSADPRNIANGLNLLQESNTAEIERWIDETLQAMPDKVKEFKQGRKNLIGLFAGDVKKRSRGKADMQVVTTILSQKLNQ